MHSVLNEINGRKGLSRIEGGFKLPNLGRPTLFTTNNKQISVNKKRRVCIRAQVLTL